MIPSLPGVRQPSCYSGPNAPGISWENLHRERSIGVERSNAGERPEKGVADVQHLTNQGTGNDTLTAALTWKSVGRLGDMEWKLSFCSWVHIHSWFSSIISLGLSWKIRYQLGTLTNPGVQHRARTPGSNRWWEVTNTSRIIFHLSN